MTIYLKIIGLLWYLVFPSVAMSSAVNHGGYPDKIISNKNITGRLASYSHGDYAHVSVKQNDEKEIGFFIDEEACFLAKHRDKLLKIKYQEVERYFNEGAGYYPANIILKIETKDGLYKWDLDNDVMPWSSDYVKNLQACHKVLEKLNAK
jgi:hypothetical protein